MFHLNGTESNHLIRQRVFAIFFTYAFTNYVYAHATRVWYNWHYISVTFILRYSSHDGFALAINVVQRNANHVDNGLTKHLCINVVIYFLYLQLHRLQRFTIKNSYYACTAVVNATIAVMLIDLTFGVLMIIQKLHYFNNYCQGQDSDTCIDERVYSSVCLLFIHEVHAGQLLTFSDTYFPLCDEGNVLAWPTHHCTYY